MNKKIITAFLGGIALTAAVSTTAPVIKDAVSPNVDAAGSCPITLQPIQSTGNLVFSPFSFYSSDLTNLRSELNDLGAWADGEISSINTEVSNGKVSLRTKMNSKGASLSTTTIPTFAQLVAAVDDVYTGGYDDGYEAFKNSMTLNTLRERIGISENTGINESITIPHDGKLYLHFALYDNAGLGMDSRSEAYVTLNGTKVNSGNYSVSSGSTLLFHQPESHLTNPETDGYIIAILIY